MEISESEEAKTHLLPHLLRPELEAAMREGKRRVNRAKITLVGPGRAGKTCVARSLLNIPFEDTASTQGIDDLGLRTTVTHAEAREGRWGEFREHEKMHEGLLAEQINERRKRCHEKPSGTVGDDDRAQDSQANVDVTDSTSAVSHKGVAVSRNTDVVPPIDVDNQFVLRALGESRNLGSGLVMSLYDYGGQEVFDVVHSFFLSPNGLYLVVFDMSWMLSSAGDINREWCLERLSSWVNTLIVHTSIPGKDGRLKCAAIALVGTHKDLVQDVGTHRDISKALETLLGRSVAWRSVLENESEGLCFFPVDCTKGQEDPTLVNLMRSIEEDILKSDYVNLERPLTYFKVLDEMNERKKTVSYLSLNEVSEVATKYGVYSILIEEMLRFFRDLGLLTWFEEDSLRDVVILDPVEFFVSPATNIVCLHERDRQGTVHTNEVLRRAKKEFHGAFEDMAKKGVVRADLLDFILTDHLRAKGSSEDRLEARVSAVVRLLRKYALLVPLLDKGSSTYLAPSLLPDEEDVFPVDSVPVYLFCSLSQDELPLFLRKDEAQQRGFLPPGLFQRFSARALAEIDATRTGDYTFNRRRQASFYIGRNRITLTALTGMGCIRIDCQGGSVYSPLKLLAGIIEEVRKECFENLRIVTMVSYPASGEELKGLIRLDLLRSRYSNFNMDEETTFDIERDVAPYARYTDSGAENQASDVFISYRWQPPFQKKVARTLFNSLSWQVTGEGEQQRNVHVYLDEERNKTGDNFKTKICFAIRDARVFLPIVTEELLQRMVAHDPSKEDYVLAEWIMALALDRKILPILVGKVADDDVSHCDELDVHDLKGKVSSEFPSKTIDFVKSGLSRVSVAYADGLFSNQDEWRVKAVVERMFQNLYLQWSAEDCIKTCGNRVVEILRNNSNTSALRTAVPVSTTVRRQPEPAPPADDCCCCS